MDAVECALDGVAKADILRRLNCFCMRNWTRQSGGVSPCGAGKTAEQGNTGAGHAHRRG
jgi:hypothetical protein